MRIPTKRPSAAMVVAMTALMVSLGGTGYAAIKLPKNSVTTTQIKNKTIATADISASAKAALKGQTGPAGPAGTALAYSDFTPDGQVQGDNQGFDGVAVSRPQPGVYCMNNLKVTVSNLMATIDAVGSDLGATVQVAQNGNDICPQGTQAEVQTYNQAGNRAPEPFYLLVN